MNFIAFRREVLEELVNDPEWTRKLDHARTHQECVQVIRDFAKAKGFKIKEV